MLVYSLWLQISALKISSDAIVLQKVRIMRDVDFVATRVLYVTNAKKMHTPGSPGYSLNRLLFPPKNEQEKRILFVLCSLEHYHNYMDQIRGELSQRLVERVFREGEWSKKWWMTFVKRNFMNLELSLVYSVCWNK